MAIPLYRLSAVHVLVFVDLGVLCLLRGLIVAVSVNNPTRSKPAADRNSAFSRIWVMLPPFYYIYIYIYLEISCVVGSLSLAFDRSLTHVL